MKAVTTIVGSDAALVLVGGSVRDILLGTIPKDYDFATALEPDEVERRVRAAGKRAYTIGKRYGTIGFRFEGHFIEVTTYRKELYDLSSRKPTVTFTTDLADDLSRRDFTFNAMALQLDGTLVDPHQGKADIENRVIRAVGIPSHRFREDPLRILRMIRFAARYGFAIDAKTLKAAKERAYTLSRISRERITAELDGIIVAPHAGPALLQLADLGILSFTIPLLAVQIGYDQNSRYHSLDLWNHTVGTLEGVEPDVELRWSALLHDVGKPFVRNNKSDRSTYVHHDLVGAGLVEMLAHHLKWSRQRTERIEALVRNHLDDESPLRRADNAAK
jgi:tRNA nucleotidyltransferase (CCA-adding enzyme)